MPATKNGPPPEEQEERRRSREVGTRMTLRSSCEAMTGPRGAQETRRSGQEHQGRSKQLQPPPPGQEHPGTRGGRGPTKGATGADQAERSAAMPDWIIQGQVAVDAPDWNIRGPASSGSRRPPDWSIRGQVTEDTPDRIIWGKTRRRQTAGEKGPDAQGKMVRGRTSRRSPSPLDRARSNTKDHGREEHRSRAEDEAQGMQSSIDVAGPRGSGEASQRKRPRGCREAEMRTRPRGCREAMKRKMPKVKQRSTQVDEAEGMRRSGQEEEAEE